MIESLRQFFELNKTLSAKTVRNHVSAILAKLNLTNRIEAAAYAAGHDIQQQLRIRKDGSNNGS